VAALFLSNGYSFAEATGLRGAMLFSGALDCPPATALAPCPIARSGQCSFLLHKASSIITNIKKTGLLGDRFFVSYSIRS